MRKRITYYLIILLLSSLSAHSAIDVSKIKGRRYFIHGLQYYNNYQYIAAIEYFTKALSANSQNLLARQFLAASYWRAGYINYAKQEYKTYLQLFPGNPVIQNRYLQIQQYELNQNNSIFIPYSILQTIDLPRVQQPIHFCMDPQMGDMWVLGLSSRNLIHLNSKNELLLHVKGGRLDFGLPYNVVVSQDKVFVSDYQRNLIHVLNHSGRGLFEIGKNGRQPGFFYGPKGMQYSSTGHLYVADSGNDRVQKFNAQGKFILEFGKSGSKLGQMDHPVAVALGSSNTGQEIVYVLEKGNQRLQSFDIYGNVIDQWTSSWIVDPIALQKIGQRYFITDNQQGVFFWDEQRKEFFRFNTLVAAKDKETIQKLHTVSLAQGHDRYIHLLDQKQGKVFSLGPQNLMMNNLNVEILSIDKKKFPVIGIRFRVYDSMGQIIQNIWRKNISVVDEGVRMQRINPRAWHYRHRALRVMLLIDNSMQMQPFVKDLKWVLDPLWQQFRRIDQIKVVHLGQDVISRTGFDWSVRRAQREVEKISLVENIRLDKALYSSISSMIASPYKKAIILLKAGSKDESSFMQYGKQTILQLARIHDIPIYVLSFSGKSLKNLAHMTNGQWIKAYDVVRIKQILRHLRSRSRQYQQISFRTFSHAALRGKVRKVQLKIYYRRQEGVTESYYLNP